MSPPLLWPPPLFAHFFSAGGAPSPHATNSDAVTPAAAIFAGAAAAAVPSPLRPRPLCIPRRVGDLRVRTSPDGLGMVHGGGDARREGGAVGAWARTR